jgi:D-alanyl-D-alanine carboxypeptidase
MTTTPRPSAASATFHRLASAGAGVARFSAGPGTPWPLADLRLRVPLFALALALALGLALALPARAQIGSERYSALVVEARSGQVQVAAAAEEPRYPASLTKLMTIYLALEAIRDGRLGWATPITASAEAASMPRTRLGLTTGMVLTAEEAIFALITKSANDAAVALGEHLAGGSEDRFAQIMTRRARELGMANTTFRNASGLPDPEQVTTARDMVLLARRLILEFPQAYPMFAVASFQWRNRIVYNHNRLLGAYEGADGMKTGYVNDSGFNLVASAQRDGVRLIGAVFGGRTAGERDRHMMAILDQGFAQLGVAPRQPPQVMVQAAPPAQGRMAVRVPALFGRAQAAALRPPAQAQARAHARVAVVTPSRSVAAGPRVAAHVPPSRVAQGDAERRVPRAAPRAPAVAQHARLAVPAPPPPAIPPARRRAG